MKLLLEWIKQELGMYSETECTTIIITTEQHMDTQDTMKLMNSLTYGYLELIDVKEHRFSDETVYEEWDVYTYQPTPKFWNDLNELDNNK